jgi:dephospho-CoA kinase
MEKKEPAYTEIIAAFGREILAENGEINRRALGEKIFSDPNERSKLEQIIHPRVIKKIRSILEINLDNSGHTFLVIDAPLLIESGINEICDSIWLITAPDELRVARITARDNIDEPTAKRRLQSRKGDNFLREKSNIIINNNSSAIALRSKIETALKAMSLKIHGWKDSKIFEI